MTHRMFENLLLRVIYRVDFALLYYGFTLIQKGYIYFSVFDE